MATVICGFNSCSYCVNGICGRAFIGIGTKRYGEIKNPACSGYTTEKVDDVNEDMRPICVKE